jgi:hypothetical protein
MQEMQQRLESGGSVGMADYESSRERIAALTLQSPGRYCCPLPGLRMRCLQPAVGASFTAPSSMAFYVTSTSPHPFLKCSCGPAGCRVQGGGVGHTGAALPPAPHHHRVPPAVDKQPGTQPDVRTTCMLLLPLLLLLAACCFCRCCCCCCVGGRTNLEGACCTHACGCWSCCLHTLPAPASHAAAVCSRLLSKPLSALPFTRLPCARPPCYPQLRSAPAVLPAHAAKAPGLRRRTSSWGCLRSNTKLDRCTTCLPARLTLAPRALQQLSIAAATHGPLRAVRAACLRAAAALLSLAFMSRALSP